MRRKSKKTKDEPTTTERRSKRSSVRRKRAQEDDEVCSEVEEEKVVEEEMTPAKTRSSRRYATRGRRQKAEETEEEASQGEEEQEEEDENSNNVATATESLSKENEVTENLKSDIAVEDKSIVSEGDGASAWKSDKNIWGMKSNKDTQDDRCEEIPAQGEGDDGEEEGSRSHSRKRKLKLSRECLQENREAIPKIRLRLSRNRSGGYETEKLEAERIETKKSEEEAVVQVVQLETVSEKEGEEENVTSEEASEVVESKEQSEEIICQEESPEAVEEKTEEVAVEGHTEEKVQEEVDDVDNCKENTDDTSSKESDEGKVETAEPEQEESDEVLREESENIASETQNQDLNLEVREEGEQIVEKVIEEAVEEGKSGQEIQEISEQEPEEGREQADVKEVEAEIEEAKVDQNSEEEEQKLDLQKSSEVTSISETVEENLDKSDSMEERKQHSDVELDVKAENSSKSPAKEEMEVEQTLGGELEKQETCSKESDEGKDEQTQEMQVSVVGEVSDQPVVEESKEAENSTETEPQKKNEKEICDAEEEMGRHEEVTEDSRDTEEVEDKKDKPEDVKVDSDSVQNDITADCIGEKEQNTEDNLKSKSEQDSRNESGDRVSRISRPKLRQEEDDMVEEIHNQSRHRRRRSRESSGEQQRLSTSEAAQPKRVTLKRPRLIRNISSSSKKDDAAEAKSSNEEPESKVEEEKGDIVTPVEESSLQESKPVEEGTVADEAMRRRRRKWGLQKAQSGPSQPKRAFISISTQSLKGLIPEVKPLPIHELRLSVEKDETRDVVIEEDSCGISMDETIVRMIDANGQNERTLWAQVVDEERTTVRTEVTRTPLVGSDEPASTVPMRRISIVSDDATRLQRSPSPPRHPPSNVLFLSNLVRPFTVQQLKELLARTGTVSEDGFWIDRIKSMCLVQYETEEQARETRHALHGVRWPISNPKRLFVDFSTKARLEEAKREGNVVAPVPPTISNPSLSPPHTAPRDDFPRKTEPLRVDAGGMVPVHHPVHRVTPGSPSRQTHAMIRQTGVMIAGGADAETATADVTWQQCSHPRPDVPVRPGVSTRDYKLPAPVREWDLDKVVQQSPPGAGMLLPNRGAIEERRRPEGTGQARDHMLSSPPPSMQEIQARKAKRKEADTAAEAPANLLDRLFRKTKATPSIYWLPLTAEQIKVKEEIRRQHLAEHERRIAEMKRAAEKDRGSRRRRRSSTPRRRSRRRSGDGGSAAHKKTTESLKGHKTSSLSPKK